MEMVQSCRWQQFPVENNIAKRIVLMGPPETQKQPCSEISHRRRHFTGLTSDHAKIVSRRLPMLTRYSVEMKTNHTMKYLQMDLTCIKKVSRGKASTVHYLKLKYFTIVYFFIVYLIVVPYYQSRKNILDSWSIHLDSSNQERPHQGKEQIYRTK